MLRNALCFLPTAHITSCSLSCRSSAETDIGPSWLPIRLRLDWGLPWELLVVLFLSILDYTILFYKPLLHVSGYFYCLLINKSVYLAVLLFSCFFVFDGSELTSRDRRAALRTQCPTRKVSHPVSPTYCSSLRDPFLNHGLFFSTCQSLLTFLMPHRY